MRKFKINKECITPYPIVKLTWNNSMMYLKKIYVALKFLNLKSYTHFLGFRELLAVDELLMQILCYSLYTNVLISTFVDLYNVH